MLRLVFQSEPEPVNALKSPRDAHFTVQTILTRCEEYMSAKRARNHEEAGKLLDGVCCFIEEWKRSLAEVCAVMFCALVLIH